MPIRPSNNSHSHSAKEKSISNFIPETSSPYLLSEEGSIGDDSDFSFEIEEETVLSPKKNSIATKKQTINEDVSVKSPKSSSSSSQPKSLHPVLSREAAQRSLKSKVEQKPSKVITSSSNKTVTYTALSAIKKDHIMGDDDFSISVASETDGLVSDVKSSSSNVKTHAVEVKQPVGSRRSVEQSRLDRRGYASDDASTTSSKTAIQSLMEKLSSMEDTSNSRTTPARPSFDTAKQTPVEKKQPPQTDTTSTSSSKIQSLKSKTAGCSIDFAESIVKSHGDIESGASTAVSTSCSSGRLGKRLWWSNGDGTMEGQKVTTPSSKRSSRRKLCCIVGFVLVAAAGTVGALIALDVILKEKLTPSSETPDTATPTKSDSNSPWYVDWDAFQCVMDCNGRPPCGGTKKNHDETFPTLKECCLEGMGNFIDEHWTLDSCMEMTAVETAIPTFSPTSEKKEETSAPIAGPQASTPSPTKSSELMYYADFSEMKCTAESTSRKAPWENGYETISDCCDANFWGNVYKECLGKANSGTETITLYYPDYGGRNCVEEYVDTKQIWDKGFDTKDECCEVNFSWDKASICFRGDEIIATTSPTSTTSSPTKSSELMYYADFSEMKCTAESTSRKAPWENGYETISDCCDANFWGNVYKECLGKADSGTETITLYYPDYGGRNCVEEYVDTKQIWDKGFDTKDECCEVNFSWDKASICFRGDEIIATTLSTSTISDSPTTMPTSSRPTTSSPTPSRAKNCPGSLDQQIVIDGSAILYYHLEPSDSGFNNGILCGRLEVNNDDGGWIGFGWSKTGNMIGGEAIVGLTDARSVLKYNLSSKDVSGVTSMPAARQTLTDTSIRLEGNKTIMTFTKMLVEDGELEIYEKGPNAFLHARGSNGQTIGYHDNGRIAFTKDFVDDITMDPATPRPTPVSSTLGTTVLGSLLSPNPTELFPTLAPITPGSPSRSPVVSARAPSRAPTSAPITPGPTRRPTSSPIKTPTLHPTSRPTTKPFVAPTSPTPSPAGELEILRAVLVNRSPISSDNLLLERSPQYRAMEWLVGNTLYDSYPYHRKIQRWALSTFYYSLYGSEWAVKDGWVNHEGNLENECTWHGVSCTASGTVMSIDLQANRLFGHVPNETSLLVDVEYLGLSENQIRSIPSSLIDLPKLKVVDLHKNRLTMIPEGDYGSSLLEELYLSYNGISSIPDGLFQLRFLKVLWLANNEISSTLPNGFGKMTHLEELDLESNLFHGPIPEEMFSLVNLALLYLYDNELTGQFPPGLSQMASLTELDLHSNYIGGHLPTEIGRFSALSELYLGNNKIIGQIPSQLFQLTSLTVLDISENFLNSTIGSGIGNLNQVTKLHLHDNYNENEGSFGIYGPIPESIGSLTLLKELRLDNNYVEGMLPPSIGDLQNLEILRLESNNLNGDIKAVTNAKKLTYVHLWSNYFSGTISNSIGQLSQVLEIFLDDNELTGSIPSEIGLLLNAKYISLGINELEGMIPSSFGMLSNLERLDLQENNLSGEIPAEMGNIKLLERIRLEGNQFFGDIPEEVCTIESLEFLSGSCAIAADTTIENSYWWSCNCCTVCDEE